MENNKWKKIKIRIRDFYRDAVSEAEYGYVTREVYNLLANTFRKEEHNQLVKDRRHLVLGAYEERKNADILMQFQKYLKIIFSEAITLREIAAK